MDFFDLHCDSPYESFRTGESFECGRLAVTREKGRVFDKWVQICAIWIPDGCESPKRRYRAVLENFTGQTKIAVKADELEADRAFLLSLEGGSPIESVNDVDMLYSDGIRAVTLTWNGKNKIAGGSNTSAELTPFGREVISRLNALKIATDVSHLNDKSFYAAIECVDFPIATHVGCRDVHRVRRNLTDRQIKLLTEKYGLVGLCFYPAFLGEGDVFSDFSRHLFHLCDMGLEDFLSVGSDFDGAEMDKRLDSAAQVPVLYDYLKNNGFEEKLLYKLFYKNAKDYFLRLLK